MTLEQGFGELIEWAKTTPDVAEDFFDRALQELQDKGLLVQGTADSGDASVRSNGGMRGALLRSSFSTTFLYRFNTLGGALGGFRTTNSAISPARVRFRRRSAVSRLQ